MRLGFWRSLVHAFPLMACILISPGHPIILNIIDFFDTSPDSTINSILSASQESQAESKNVLKQTWLLNLGNLDKESPQNVIQKFPEFLQQLIKIEEIKHSWIDGSLDLERDRLGSALESLIIVGCPPQIQETIRRGTFRKLRRWKKCLRNERISIWE